MICHQHMLFHMICGLPRHVITRYAVMTGLAPIDHRKIKAITFDYFGTLVDVDQGAAGGMARGLRALGRTHLDPLETYLRWGIENVPPYPRSAHRRYRGGPAQGMRRLSPPPPPPPVSPPGARPQDPPRLG